MATQDLKTDHMPLIVECSWSNIGLEWTADARHEDSHKTIAFGRGSTRPDALRELADALEDLG